MAAGGDGGGSRWMWVRAGDVRNDRPLYQPLLDALAGRTPPTWRRVPVGERRIEPAFAAGLPAGVVAFLAARWGEVGERGPANPVPVMRRRDGSRWVYDDVAWTLAAQRVDPARRVPCAAYEDPTQ